MSHRILVVDDDPDVQASVVELLHEIGCSSATARNGSEALTMLDRASDISAVLCDVVMPVMSGVELARRVHATRPDTPVVLMTGRDSYVESVIDAGAVPLLKPFSSTTLQRILGESLGTLNASRPR